MRDLRLLLASLLIACFVWAMHTFSLDYFATVPCTVHVTTSLEGYAPDAVARETMLLRGKASGFFLLKARGTGRKTLPVDIEVEPRHFHPVTGTDDAFYLYVSDIRDRLVDCLGDRFSIDYIETERLTFTFVPQSYVKVPVAASLDLTFRPQFMQVGEVRLKPDSVLVYGAVTELQRISEVRTRSISAHGVDKSLGGIVTLEPIAGLRFDIDRIEYEVTVDRYVETTLTLPVTAVHVPVDRTLMILPSQVEITFRSSFRPRGGRITADDLALVVDYDDFAGAGSTRVIPRLVTTRSIYSWRLRPELVECIQLEDR